MSDRSGDPGRPALPRSVGIGVLITVLILIGVVLAAQFIPDAERPRIEPGPSFATITVTSTPTP